MVNQVVINKNILAHQLLICFFVWVSVCSVQNTAAQDPPPAAALITTASDSSQHNIITLLTKLASSDHRERINAAEELGASGDLRAVESLILLLENDDVWGVRKSAAWALGELKDKRAVGPLISSLQHHDWIIRFKAAEALGKIRDSRAVGPLIKTLRDGNQHVYGQVAWALGEICDDRAVIPLIQALANELPAVRMNAAQALGNIGNADAVEPLIKLLQREPNADVQIMAIQAMGTLKDPRSVDPLIKALNDADYYVRLNAELSLELIGNTAIAPLIAALKTSRFHQQTRTVWALEEITGQNFGNEIAAWEQWIIEHSAAPSTL